MKRHSFGRPSVRTRLAAVGVVAVALLALHGRLLRDRGLEGDEARERRLRLRRKVRLLRMLVTRLALDLPQFRFHRNLRHFLQRWIDRRVNFHPAVFLLLIGQQLIQLALHQIHRVVFLRRKRPLFRQRNRPAARLLRLAFADFSELHHPRQHHVALVQRAFQIFERRKK